MSLPDRSKSQHWPKEEKMKDFLVQSYLNPQLKTAGKGRELSQKGAMVKKKIFQVARQI